MSPIVGFNQGLYRVERVAGADVVRDRSGQALPETAVAALSARAGKTPAPQAGGAQPSLEQFLAAVRAARPR